MAEKIISPGVFTKEIDASFLPAAIGNIGAAVVGPTVKGPALVPTVVSSYAEYQAKFGDTFKSGSSTYQYLTSIAAANYLKHSGKLTVVRILDGNGWDTPAEASVTIDGDVISGNSATGSVVLAEVPSGSAQKLSINSIDFVGVISASLFDDTSTERYFTIGSEVDVDTLFGPNLRKAINDANDASTCDINVSASYTNDGNVLDLTAGVGTAGNSYGPTTSSIVGNDQEAFMTFVAMEGGTGGGIGATDTIAFKLKTHSHGAILNNSGSDLAGANSVLVSGSKDNIRWEISSKNDSKGSFTLLIRRGDDSIKRKQIMETWNNCSLDPNAPNYIAKMLGDSYQSIQGTTNDPYIQFVGNYPPK